MGEKKIKDYLHLYLGCECMVIGIKHILSGTYPPDACFVNTLSGLTLNPIDITSVQPILRPLSDISEEEKLFTINIRRNKKEASEVMPFEAYGEVVIFLLSKHFDLFGLIPAGLAIDKTTLK